MAKIDMKKNMSVCMFVDDCMYVCIHVYLCMNMYICISNHSPSSDPTPHKVHSSFSPFLYL